MAVPITFVTETHFTETVTATTGTVTPGNTAGNLLVLTTGGRGSVSAQTVSTVADTGGNTWTLVTAKNAGATTNNIDLEVWYSLTTAVAGTVTVTWSGLVSSVISCLEFAGASSSWNVANTPRDQFGSNSGTTVVGTKTATMGTATTEGWEMLVGCAAQIGTAAFTSQSFGGTGAPSVNLITQQTSAVTGLNSTLQAAYGWTDTPSVADSYTVQPTNNWAIIVASFLPAMFYVPAIPRRTPMQRASAW